MSRPAASSAASPRKAPRCSGAHAGRRRRRHRARLGKVHVLRHSRRAAAASRIEFSKGNVTITDVAWLVAENPLTFGGTVGLAAEDPPLDLSVKGLVDLRVLSAFTSAVAFDGNADVNTRIAGTFAKPLLDGRITLDGAEIAIPSRAWSCRNCRDRSSSTASSWRSTACAVSPTAARLRSTARSSSKPWRSAAAS